MNYPLWHPFSQKRFQETPPVVRSAKGAYLTLESGERLLDMVCSWWVTLHGHGQPEIARAIYEQALSLDQVLFANFSHEPALELSKKLTRALFPEMTKVYFSDNGSTAVEVALKMAYQFFANRGEEKRRRFVCFEQAYHGDTLGAMSASEDSVFTGHFKSLLFPVDRLPYPAVSYSDPEAEEKEALALDLLKKHLEKHSGEVAAILIEPLIQGAGGMRMCRTRFLQELETLAQQEGVLVIYDEVMVGFGRTGALFACKKAGTKPDLICLSKGITGGLMPLSVTVCGEEIFDALYHLDPKKNFYHGHSYTANPLGCAAANASFELLSRNPESYQRLEALHERLMNRLLLEHPLVRRARFCGTIMAFDIEAGEEGYLNPVGKHIQAFCRERGIFLRPLGNTIYLMPPYCIKEEELAFCYRTLKEALDSLEQDAQALDRSLERLQKR